MIYKKKKKMQVTTQHLQKKKHDTALTGMRQLPQFNVTSKPRHAEGYSRAGSGMNNKPGKR